jgi:hypothetical protein
MSVVQVHYTAMTFIDFSRQPVGSCYITQLLEEDLEHYDAKMLLSNHCHL